MTWNSAASQTRMKPALSVISPVSSKFTTLLMGLPALGVADEFEDCLGEDFPDFPFVHALASWERLLAGCSPRPPPSHFGPQECQSPVPRNYWKGKRAGWPQPVSRLEAVSIPPPTPSGG